MIGIALFCMILVLGCIWSFTFMGLRALAHWACADGYNSAREEVCTILSNVIFIAAFISTVCYLAFVFDPMIR